MSKYHKIKWTEQDTKEISRVVKNFNAKITRLSKKDPSIANLLPNKVTTKQFKELINTRQDLKRELNSLKRFSKKGAEKIVVIPDTEYNLKTTNWQKVEMNRRVGIINRRRKTRLEEMQNRELKSGGKSLGYTLGQLGMGKAKEVALSPMTPFFRTMNNADLKKRWESIVTQSQSDYFTKRDYQARDNYIKGLMENYNTNNIQDIIDEIRSMDIQDFLDTMESEDSTFEFASPKAGSVKVNDNNQLDIKLAEYDAYETHLRSIWLPNK